jgi:hypothetical protein
MKNIINAAILFAAFITHITASANSSEDTGDEEPLCLVDVDGNPYPCFPWVNCPNPTAPVPDNCDADGNCWCGEDGGEGHRFNGRNVMEDIDGRPISCHIVHGNEGICGMLCGESGESGESGGRRTVVSVCKETTCNDGPCLSCDGYDLPVYILGTCRG